MILDGLKLLLINIPAEKHKFCKMMVHVWIVLYIKEDRMIGKDVVLIYVSQIRYYYKMVHARHVSLIQNLQLIFWNVFMIIVTTDKNFQKMAHAKCAHYTLRFQRMENNVYQLNLNRHHLKWFSLEWHSLGIHLQCQHQVISKRFKFKVQALHSHKLIQKHNSQTLMVN